MREFGAIKWSKRGEFPLVVFQGIMMMMKIEYLLNVGLTHFIFIR